MSEPLRDHIESLLLFAGLSGLLSALYRFGLPASVISRHHDALTSFFAWASRGGWLDLMQSAVRLVLRVMTFVYGPPTETHSGGARRFLTIQAWRMSAWIATLILFLVPMVVLCVVIPFLPNFNRTPEDWRAWGILLGVTLLLGGVFYLTLRQVRLPHARSDRHRVPSLAESSLRACVVIGLPLVLGVIAITANDPKILFEPADYFGVIFTAIFFAGLIFCFVQALRDYAFAAPLAFVVQTMTSALVIGPIVFVLGGYHDHLVKAKAAPSLFAIVIQVPTAVLAFLILALYLLSRLKGRRLGASLAVLACLEIMELSLVGWLLPGHSVPGVARTVISAPLLFFVPYVLALYAAVYSNSLPDWLSIALTRHILGQAGSSTSLRKFALWLAADALAVSLFVLATFIILVGVFTLCSEMVAFASRIGEVPQFDGVRRYFSGSREVFPLVVEATRHGALTASFGDSPEHAGALSVLVLVLLSATSLIPTLLNALILVGLIAGRAAALLLGRPLKALHGLLLIDDGSRPEQRALSLWRSSGIFGTVGALLYVLGYPFVAAFR